MALIPEKRLDKNGRVVTKHVRAEPRTASSKAAIPPPVAATPVASQSASEPLTARYIMGKFQPTAKQLEPGFYALDSSSYAPDADLVRSLKLNTNDYLRFTANHIEFCEMLAITSPDNAIALMAGGVTTPDEARDYLKKNRMEGLFKDRAWEARELLRRKVAPLYYAEIAAKDADTYSSPAWVVDAAEAHSVKALRYWVPVPPIPTRILHGAVRLSDIKTVGATRLVKADPQGEATLNVLGALAKGEPSITAEEMRQLIAHFQEGGAKLDTMNRVYSFAQRYGTDFTCGLYNMGFAWEMENHMWMKRTANEDHKEIIAYADKLQRIQVERKTEALVTPALAVELFYANVDPTDGVIGLEKGWAVNQIAAVNNDDIAPSVASGWL